MITRIFWLASTHARLCLILGLAAGLLLPGFAATLVTWLPHMVAALLTTTALRIGHQAAMGPCAICAGVWDRSLSCK